MSGIDDDALAPPRQCLDQLVQATVSVRLNHFPDIAPRVAFRKNQKMFVSLAFPRQSSAPPESWM
jgi:hypothetical protein